jgi:signal transduction histidine kinase
MTTVDEEHDTEEPRRRFRVLPRTVRGRITVIATLAFAIAISAVAFGLVSLVRNNLNDSIQANNQRQLNQLQAAVQSAIDHGDLQPGPSRPVCGLGVDGQVHCYQQAPQRDGYEAAQREVNTTAGNITLVAEQSIAEVDRTVDSVTRALLIAVPGLVILMGLATWYFTGRALRPVEAIRLEAEEITGTTMHRRVPEPDTDDEVGRLARTMNAMLARLETSTQKQRQFVSDASHELRTPLASIRANLEVALRNEDSTHWPEVARRVLSEDERMEDTVAELLELARLDEADAPLPIETLPDVDLDEVVADLAITPRRVPVDTTKVSAGRVHGREDQLARAIRNLVDNAARHATTKVSVTLTTNNGATANTGSSSGAGQVVLFVDDDGTGIAPDDRARVFERFTRLDEGRARDAGGLGLGLALVKGIVESHHGTVVIDDSPLGGARFTVSLPAA